VTSALGLLLADAKADHVQTVLLELGPGAAAPLAAAVAGLRARVERELPEASGARTVTVTAEARYRRQGHDLRVAFPEGPIDDTTVAVVADRFHAAHAERFGYAIRDEPVVLVNILVTCVVPSPYLALGETAQPAPPRPPASRLVLFGGGFVETSVVDRAALVPGDELEGPAVVEQFDTTVVVPPGARATCLEDSSLAVALPSGR
jgi:N-methylhydantoinase A